MKKSLNHLKSLLQSCSIKNKGDLAENKALEFLEAKGMSLLERNYRCRFGEIDLIMLDREETAIVAVEVRYRNTHHFGGAIESVNTTKQKRLIITLEHFWVKNLANKLKALSKDNASDEEIENYNFRFDVVAFSQEHSQLKCRWIKNAFEAF